MRDTERYRRTGATVLQWAGWLTAIGIGAWSESTHRVHTSAPQWTDLAFVFALGVAIAATVARSRIRLAHTIVDAFKAGQQLAREDTNRRVDELHDGMDDIQRRIMENSRIINRQLNDKDD